MSNEPRERIKVKPKEKKLNTSDANMAISDIVITATGFQANACTNGNPLKVIPETDARSKKNLISTVNNTTCNVVTDLYSVCNGTYANNISCSTK